MLLVLLSLEYKRERRATVLIVGEENKWMLRGRPEKGWNLFHNTYSTFPHCHPKECLWNWDNVTFFFFHFLHLGFPNNGGCICLCICVCICICIDAESTMISQLQFTMENPAAQLVGDVGKVGNVHFNFLQIAFLTQTACLPARIPQS